VKQQAATWWMRLAVVAAAMSGLWIASGVPGAAAATSVSIAGTRFLVDGQVTYRGAPAEGLLLNSRMVQALYDDDNPLTAGLWAYPDTGRWQPERNTDEFIAALPAYAAHGLGAVTLSLQGGMPQPDAGFQPWEVSAFRSDGSLKPAWLARLDRALAACETHGIVAIVTLFYFGQDYRLQNEAAILAATDAISDWLTARGSPNVLLEINNESSDSGYSHPILRPNRVHELVARVRMRTGGKLPVSTSFAPGVPGGVIPPDTVIAASDYLLVHGNGLNPTGIRTLVERVRQSPSYQTHPKPIVFNEDSTELPNLEAAINAHSSWGYYDQGQNNYRDGYQSPPINWTINTPTKHAFFQRTLTLAGGPNRPPPPPRRNEPPVATFAVTSAQAPVDVPIGFTSTSHDPDGSVASLLWIWGDGSPGDTRPATSHGYRAAGSYTVTLTVVDNDGARAHASRTVTIEAPPATAPPAPPPPAAAPALPAPAPAVAVVSRAALSLTLGELSLVPQRPQAGGRLRVRVRLDVSGEATARPRIGCEARVRDRPLVPLTRRLRANGEVECAWRVPRRTRGRWLWGAVTVSSAGVTARAVFSRRVG